MSTPTRSSRSAPHRTRAPEPRRRQSPPALASAVVALLVVLGQVLVALDLDVAVLRPLLSLTLLIGVPALVLARRVSWSDEPVRRLLYGVGTAVGGVLVVALLLDVALPPLGVDRPLDRIPVTIASAVADLLLLAWRPSIALVPEPRAWLRRALTLRLDGAVAVAVLALVLGVVGAVRLNNGASAAVATDAHLIVGLALVVALAARGRGGVGRDALVLYLSGLSLLLATSLRGWVIVGHDIQSEFAVFTVADDAARWRPSALAGAYNACLSLNVLPVAVSNHTGLSGVVVFKLLAPVLFALVPVGVLVFSRRLVDRRTALLAAVVVICFPTFFTDMPYLVRQEVAFFFLMVLLLASQELEWRLWARRVAVTYFGVLVVLSHYSTTYLMLLALLVAAVGVPLGRWVSRVWAARRPGGRGVRDDYAADRPRLAIAHPLVVAALIAVTYLWTVPATHSGGHLFDTVAQTAKSLVDGDSGPGSSDLAYGIFAGHQATPRQRLDLFVQDTLTERARFAGQGFLINDLGPDVLTPTIVEPADLPVTPLGDAVDATPVNTGILNSLVRGGSAALLQGSLLLGMLLLVLRRGPIGRFGPEARWLSLGVMVSLGLQVAIPGLSADYGVLRAFQQALLVTAPVLALGLVAAVGWVTRVVRRSRWSWPVVVAVVAALFVSLTGTVARLTGGYPGQLAVGDSGQYYDLYYRTQSQVDAATWVAQDSGGAPVQAQEVSGSTGSNEFYPTQLREGTYVFFTGENVTEHQATLFYTGNLITYVYPVDEVARKLNLVYSGDRAEVYR